MLDCEPVKRLRIKGPFLSDPVTNLNNKRLHHARLPFYSCCFLIQCRTERVKESGVEFVLKRPGHGCVCMPRKSACPQIHCAHHLNRDLPNKHCYAAWQAPALAPCMWVNSAHIALTTCIELTAKLLQWMSLQKKDTISTFHTFSGHPAPWVGVPCKHPTSVCCCLDRKQQNLVCVFVSRRKCF